MTQLNTPYPATAYLTGFLRQHAARLGFEVAQADPALELFLRLFSRDGPRRARRLEAAELRQGKRTPPVTSFLAHADGYVDTVDAAVRFLQGRDPGLALRIVGRDVSARGAALRRAPTRTTRGSARLGVRRARHRGPRAPPRQPLRRRPRRRDPRRRSTRASSCRATASSWRRARPRSIRCATRSKATPTLVDDAARRAQRASSSPSIAPTSSG